MKNQRGATIIEVVVAVVLVLIGFYALMDLFYFQRTASLRVDRFELTKSIMAENTFEIEGVPYDKLPKATECKVRKYDVVGNLQSESTASAGSSECSKDTVTDSPITIIWRVYDLKDSDVTFSTTSMGLPVYGNPVKRINLIGVYKTGSISDVQRTIDLTLYKAEGG